MAEGLRLLQQLAPGRRAVRQAEAEVVERGERADRADEEEREERDEGSERVRQDVPEHDPRVGEALDAGGVDERPRAQAQELGADVGRDADPVEDRVAREQQPERAPERVAEEDHHVEERDRRPDLREALAGDVDPPHEVALHRAERDAERERGEREQEPESDRRPCAVDDAREDVAPRGVEPEGMPGDRAEGEDRRLERDGRGRPARAGMLNAEC